MTLALLVMLTLLFHLHISRFTPFMFTTGLPIGNDESKMELKKRVTILPPIRTSPQHRRTHKPPNQAINGCGRDTQYTHPFRTVLQEVRRLCLLAIPQVHCLGIPQAGRLLQQLATQAQHVPPFTADCGLDAVGHAIPPCM
jgi:hypothetical protein